MNRLLIGLIVALTAVFATKAHAATTTDTVISLITCHPGSEIYELEGHSALRIQMPAADVAVSYGLFNFREPNFVYRFVKGETDYMAGAIPWDIFVQEYSFAGRRVDQQVLNLTSEQKQRLIDIVSTNLLPENCRYRYNYVKDNCATRPLAAIEGSIQPDSLVLGTSPVEASTFREVMRMYHRNYPWYQFGIDLALGSGIDYTLAPREYNFAPVLLQQQVAGATVNGRPLVSSATTIVDSPTSPVAGPTPWYLTPMAVCWAIFVLLAVATVHDLRRRRTTRWVDALYFGLLGLTGCIVTFLIFVSVHEATSPNYLFMWLNPLCFVPTIFIWLKNGKNVVISYQFVNFALVMLLCLLWAWLPQSANRAFWPLILADLMRSASYIYINFKNQKPLVSK